VMIWNIAATTPGETEGACIYSRRYSMVKFSTMPLAAWDS